MKPPKTPRLTAAGLALLLTVAACSKKESVTPAPAPLAREEAAAAPEMKATGRIGEVAAAPAAPPSADSAASSVTNTTVEQQMGSSAATYTDGERKFIRTANANFAVKDVYVAALGIEDTVAGHGGFVVDSSIGASIEQVKRYPAGDGKLIELKEVNVVGELTVRVPSDRTQEFLRAIVKHIVVLDARTFSARDAQFDLLRRQLEMARNQEAQRDLGDAIDQGGRLRHRADVIGQRNMTKAARDEALLAQKVFEDQIAFSTISLTLSQPTGVQRSEVVDLESAYRHHRPGFFTRLGESMHGGWDGFLDTLVWLARAWPFLIGAGLIAAGLWRIRRRTRKSAANS